jgi:hypothetical protein
MSYRSTDGDTRNWSDSDGGELSESDDESSADYEDGYEYQNQNDYVAVGDGEEEVCGIYALILHKLDTNGGYILGQPRND